jgi:hypothetical protein
VSDDGAVSATFQRVEIRSTVAPDPGDVATTQLAAPEESP